MLIVADPGGHSMGVELPHRRRGEEHTTRY